MKTENDISRCYIITERKEESITSGPSSFAGVRKGKHVSYITSCMQDSTYLLHHIQIIGLNSDDLLPCCLFNLFHLRPCPLVVNKVNRDTLAPKATSPTYLQSYAYESESEQ